MRDRRDNDFQNREETTLFIIIMSFIIIITS